MSLYRNRGAKRAREAREDLELGIGPLPDVVAAVEAVEDVHVLVLDLPDGIAGAYVDRVGMRLLLVNGADAVPRQRFTVAHEFGHLRMNHGSVVDRPEAISGYDYEPVEVMANAFAAELLMPRRTVAAWGRRHIDGVLTLEHVVRFAAEFGVSATAARIAFANAEVETRRKHLDRLDEEIAAADHVTLFAGLGLVMVDDELARVGPTLPRIPDALRDSAFCALLAGRIDLERFAAILGRPVADARAMVEGLGIGDLLAV